MICIGIFETDKAKKALLRQWLVSFSLQQNCEIELLWFAGNEPQETVKKYAYRLQIAIMEGDTPDGIVCGQQLYSQNPDCRIIYYKGNTTNLEDLFPARPIGFYLWESAQEAFMTCLQRVYQEVQLAQATFLYETKRRMHLIPKQNILYFQSDLRYVDIYLQQGEPVRLLTKLSALEQPAGRAFLRIHKSYLVNTQCIMYIDKNNHTVVLKNGQQLPISDAQYESVLQACQDITTKREV